MFKDVSARPSDEELRTYARHPSEPTHEELSRQGKALSASLTEVTSFNWALLVVPFKKIMMMALMYFSEEAQRPRLVRIT